MRCSIVVVAVLAVLFVGPTVNAMPLMYNINLAVGPGSVTGTLETDGTTGFLSASNILSWSVTLFDGVDSATFANSDLGADFSANPTLLFADLNALTLDFTTIAGGNLAFVGNIEGFAFFAAGSGNAPGGSMRIQHDDEFGFPLHIAGVSNIGAETFTFGEVQGPVVPEPTTLALFGLGLAGTGIARRRKRKA